MKTITKTLTKAVVSLCALAASTSVMAQESGPAGGLVPGAAASLDGFQEVPAAIFTSGVGSVRLTRNGDGFDYELRYARLEGDITQSVGVHIHFGRPGVNGGITAFLCEGAGLAAPIGTPLCIDNGTGAGVVKGRITAESILAVDGQGFPAGDLDAFNTIIRNRAAYVNLHTTAFPSGEIRGAVRPFRR